MFNKGSDSSHSNFELLEIEEKPRITLLRNKSSDSLYAPTIVSLSETTRTNDARDFFSFEPRLSEKTKPPKSPTQRKRYSEMEMLIKLIQDNAHRELIIEFLDKAFNSDCADDFFLTAKKISPKEDHEFAAKDKLQYIFYRSIYDGLDSLYKRTTVISCFFCSFDKKLLKHKPTILQTRNLIAKHISDNRLDTLENQREYEEEGCFTEIKYTIKKLLRQFSQESNSQYELELDSENELQL